MEPRFPFIKWSGHHQSIKLFCEDDIIFSELFSLIGTQCDIVKFDLFLIFQSNTKCLLSLILTHIVFFKLIEPYVRIYKVNVSFIISKHNFVILDYYYFVYLFLFA